MQTSCPECRTTFRVTQAQLGLRRGLVRCGTCNAVFNAYDTLLPELAEPPAGQSSVHEASESVHEPVAQVGVPAPHEVPAAELSTSAAASFSPDPQDEGQDRLLSALHEATSQEQPATQVERALSGYLQAAEPPALQSSGEKSADETLMPDPPVVVVRDHNEAILLSELPRPGWEKTVGRPRWKTVVYLLLSVLLLVLLLVQWAYFLRGNLAAAMPESRPWLEAMCQPFACQVPLPAQLSRQAIVSSSLENDPEQKSRVRLSFLLANRTAQPQAWPHVVLTLVDVREAPVAQKIFPPEVYLPKPLSPRAGFPARSEQEGRVDLDIGSLAAASYVLNVVYP